MSLTHTKVPRFQVLLVCFITLLSNPLPTSAYLLYDPITNQEDSKWQLLLFHDRCVTYHFIPVPFNLRWDHLSDIQLADPDLDALVGSTTFLKWMCLIVEVLLQGLWIGPPGSQITFAMQFGWVLAGKTNSSTQGHHIVFHHASPLSLEITSLASFGKWNMLSSSM